MCNVLWLVTYIYTTTLTYVMVTCFITGSVPHSLSPYPSEEEEAYFRQVPQPGFPTPPRGLKLEHRGNSALVLRWQQSKILDAEGKEVNKPLLGMA